MCLSFMLYYNSLRKQNYNLLVVFCKKFFNSLKYLISTAIFYIDNMLYLLNFVILFFAL